MDHNTLANLVGLVVGLSIFLNIVFIVGWWKERRRVPLFRAFYPKVCIHAKNGVLTRYAIRDDGSMVPE